MIEFNEQDSQQALRIFSFGGGVQSHGVLILQALGLLKQPYDAFVFANVGADSENPATLAYIETYTKPFCERHGLNFVEVHKKNRAQEQVTLVGEIYRQRKSCIIPARMSNGAPGNRKCTSEFKIRVVDKYVKSQQAAYAVIGLGISMDEFQRMRSTHWSDKESDSEKARPQGFWKKREYSLIDMRLTRRDCLDLAVEMNLPIPPKSACFFCPFKKTSEWLEMRSKQPELFQKAIAIEHEINAVRGDLKKDYVYLHPSLTPLQDAVADMQPFFDVDDNCESGYCMT